MRAFRHPAEAEIALTDVLHALSDPTRLAIVRSVATEGQLSCGSFDALAPKSTLSHHFKVLREAGVLHSRADGTKAINTVRRDELERRFPGLLGIVLAAEGPV